MNKPGGTSKSRNYDGIIGNIVPSASFPLSNLLIRDNEYDSDGNWAFCRFDDDDIYAARIGFQRGAYDFTDFGGKSADSFLQLHTEVMTRDGAYIWIATGNYSQEEVKYSPDKMDVSLPGKGGDIFRIHGWPEMRWKFRTDDDFMEVNMAMTFSGSTIFNDYILPNNTFSMCISVGWIRGEVRIGNINKQVSGSVFYDHARFLVEKKPVRAPKWQIYTPIAMGDGGRMVGLYSEDTEGKRLDPYSCAKYINASGEAVWLTGETMEAISFDTEGHPKYWRQIRKTHDLEIVSDSYVRPTKIQKAWGQEGMSLERKDHKGIPLVVDGNVTVYYRNGRKKKLNSTGLSEYFTLL